MSNSKPSMEDNKFYKKLKKRWEEMNRIDSGVEEKNQKLEMNLETFLSLTRVNRDSLRDRYFVTPTTADREEKEQPAFTRTFIQQMYMICQINPEEFLHETEEEFEKNKLSGQKTKEEQYIEKRNHNAHNYFTWPYWKELRRFIPPRNPNIQIKIIPPTSPKSKSGELKDFYKSLADNYYKKATKSIEVHELLFKGNNKNPGGYNIYSAAQSEIFGAIEEVLKKYKDTETFSYKRVFYISPSESLHLRPVNDKDKFIRFVMEASLETLGHVNKCLKEYPEGLCEFYIAPFSKFRAHCLIDDKIFITEDYERVVHDEEDYIVPQLLFIDDVEVKSEVQKLKGEFDIDLGFKSGKKPKKVILRLDRNDLSVYIENCKRYLEQEITKRKNSVKMLKELQGKPEKLQNFDFAREELKRLKDQEERSLDILDRQMIHFLYKYLQLI